MKWFAALKEKNGLKALDSAKISDEKIQEQVDSFAKQREEVIDPYTEKMGNCEVILLGGDHMIYEQKPEECGEVIKSFIDGLDS